MNSKSLLFRLEREELLREASRRYLGEELLHAEPLSGGLFNTTYRLETRQRKVILRLGPVNRHLLLPYERSLMAAEGDILELLQHSGIPTSRILALDLSRSLFDRDVMVVECLEAVSMSAVELPKETERRICREAGVLTAKIHSILASDLPDLPEKPFGRYANVIAGYGCATWEEAIFLELEQWKTVAQAAALFSEEEMSRIETVFRKFRALFREITQPRLVHADLWYGNILVDREHNLAAIIDADRAFFGDTEYEFATGWMISDSFLEGYGSKPEGHPHAVLRRKLYKLLLNLEDCYILFCEYGNPEEGANLKQRILEEIRLLEDL